MSINRFTQFTQLLMIVALFVALSGCDLLQEILSPPEPEIPTEIPVEMPPMTQEIPIGVVLAQTGDNAAPYGLPMLDGFNLASKHINDSGMLGSAKLKLIVKDDQSTSAVAGVNELIAQGVSAITGFAISTQLKEVIPLAQENEVVLFSSVSSAPGLSALGDFIFRAGLTSTVINPPLVQATHQRFGYEQAATLYLEGDVYSTLSDETFREALADTGVEVLATETFEDGTVDYSDQLTRIMTLDPDVLFISTLSPHISPLLIKARELMPSVHIIVPELTSLEVVQSAGNAAEGVVTSIGWRITDAPMNQTFIESYTAAYGEAPVAWAAQSYATLHILAAAIQNAQSVESTAVESTTSDPSIVNTASLDSTAIRDALAGTMDFETVLGDFSFDADGDAIYAPNLLIVKDGEFVVFE